jgi:hypothetical protein
VFLALSAYPLWVQFAGPQRVHGDVVASSRYYVTLADLVTPNRLQLLDVRAIPANANGSRAYLGAALLLALPVAVWLLRRRRMVQVAAVTGAVMLVLTLGTQLRLAQGTTGAVALPWRALQHIPLFGNVLPMRMPVIVFLAVAVIVAVACDHLGEVRPSQRMAGGLVLGAALIPLVPTAGYPIMQRDAPAFFTGTGVQRIAQGGAVLVEPLTRLYDPVWWQAISGIRFRQYTGAAFVPHENGRPVFGPVSNAIGDRLIATELGSEVPPITASARAAYLAALRAMGTHTVVVGPFDPREQAVPDLDHLPPQALLTHATLSEMRIVRFWTELLGSGPRRVGGVYAWFDCCAAAH